MILHRDQIAIAQGVQTPAVSRPLDTPLPPSDLFRKRQTYHSIGGGVILKLSAGFWASLTSERYYPAMILTSEPLPPSVEWCQSYDDLLSDFRRMRNQFNARYVRLYSWCDDRNNDFPTDLIRAAYNAGIGMLSVTPFCLPYR
jgi:hypothetical protein